LIFLALLLIGVCSFEFLVFCCVLFDGFELENTKNMTVMWKARLGAIVPEGGRCGADLLLLEF
jgi:hypothetical protein